jgi:hypothetical protein
MMGAAGGPGAGPRSRIFRDSKHGAALRHLPSGCHQVNTAWLRGALLPGCQRARSQETTPNEDQHHARGQVRALFADRDQR